MSRRRSPAWSRCCRLPYRRSLLRHLRLASLIIALAALSGGAARAEQPVVPDSALVALVDEALRVRPELAQALAEESVARERVPQAQALPDPMLQVGVQNDSFNNWNVGKGETSWISFMAAQTFPFPGKLGLRGDIAESEVRQGLLRTERVRLTTAADVRRAYLGLQLARERRLLLEKLTALWEKSAGVAQSRYEAGEGAQSDVLRARLELARLQQRHRLLDVEERLQEQALNRLCRRPLDQRVDTSLRLDQLDFPRPPEEVAALADARARSPELLSARSRLQRAEQTKELAHRAYLPDLSVGAGVMVRGQLDPMWTVTLGVPLPVFAGSKQGRSVAEATAATEVAQSEIDGLDQLLALRTHQRLDLWRTLREVWQSYQQGLLAQAEATAESTLGQYRVGKVSFASVLEANVGTITEAEAAFQVLADGWRLAIAQEEVSLSEVGASAAPASGASSAAGSGTSPGM